jgi:hypothetical protein
MTERRVALFIDAENLPATTAAAILTEAGRHGSPTARHVYGDFSRPALAPWLDAAPRHALKCCQTVSGAAGKNGADIALVIDVMDRLHAGETDIFCLATSDGDFAQLAMRIRQGARTVVGVGMAMASLKFKSACDVFKVVEPAHIQNGAGAAVPSDKQVQRPLEADLLQRVFIATPPACEGWVALPDIMKHLRAYRPTFDPKTYGHRQLSKLLSFSGAELSDRNRLARLKTPLLKKVVDNG